MLQGAAGCSVCEGASPHKLLGRSRSTWRASLNHIINFFKGSPARASEVATLAAVVELFILHSVSRALSVCALIDCRAAINELIPDFEGHVLHKATTFVTRYVPAMFEGASFESQLFSLCLLEILYNFMT